MGRPSVLVVVLGGATVWFHNADLHQVEAERAVLGRWALALLGQPGAVPQEPAAGRCSASSSSCRQPVWQRLNFAWIAFFALMGVLNLYVAYTFSTSTWATFKVFGVTGLMLVFMLAQGFYICAST